MKVKKIRTEADDYSALNYLTEFYFDQDYDVISEELDDIVRVFKYENQPLHYADLPRDIERFVQKYGHSEEELDHAFNRVFRPQLLLHGPNGRTLHEALSKIAEIITDPNDPGFPRP
ncbi:MAG: contact-dependent growth inhibition system immunity protein [Janthinobacterium lividum]